MADKRSLLQAIGRPIVVSCSSLAKLKSSCPDLRSSRYVSAFKCRFPVSPRANCDCCRCIPVRCTSWPAFDKDCDTREFVNPSARSFRFSRCRSVRRCSLGSSQIYEPRASSFSPRAGGTQNESFPMAVFLFPGVTVLCRAMSRCAALFSGPHASEIDVFSPVE